MSNVRTDSFAHYVNGEFVLRNVAARTVPVTSDVHVSDDEYVTVGIEYYPRPDYYPHVRVFLSIVSGGECVLSVWLSNNRVGSVLVRGTIGECVEFVARRACLATEMWLRAHSDLVHFDFLHEVESRRWCSRVSAECENGRLFIVRRDGHVCSISVDTMGERKVYVNMEFGMTVSGLYRGFTAVRPWSQKCRFGVRCPSSTIVSCIIQYWNFLYSYR